MCVSHPQQDFYFVIRPLLVQGYLKEGRRTHHAGLGRLDVMADSWGAAVRQGAHHPLLHMGHQFLEEEEEEGE